MTDTTNPPNDRPTVLVPIGVLEGETLPDGIPELLANAHVILLGYHVLPEQTPPGQARMQFEDRAQRKLAEFEATLEAAGATVQRQLVFTHSEQQTFDRMLAEHDCLAVLVPNACEPPGDVLVAIRRTVDVERITRLVAGLFASAAVTVTLYHGLIEDETREDAEAFLEEVAERLERSGLADAAVEYLIDDDEGGVDRIAELAEGYDAVVMGETDPSVATFIFGMPSRQVAERFLGPVLVVQREDEDRRTS